MNAEVMKLRALPLPRWTTLGVFGALVTAIVIAAFAGMGEENVAIGIGADLATSIGSMILGVWIVGLEYGQGTMRRVLSANPRRGRVLAAKLATALLAAAVLTIVVYAISAAAFPPIADAHDQSLSVGDVVRMCAAALIGNLAYAAMGVAFALLTRSMAGGITLALGFAFIVDSALSAIPRVGDYAPQSAYLEIWDAITQEPG
ncbi:MAG: ABC transporter permease subunit, partial [Thermoleophilia bacterium]